ncbi:hypothetical protein QYF61_008578 [Mycteria americana]|uniref:Rna-directed dna polymerase from mobile element jockey-like n=1 Tax=Mycteria americana TaxID=33587 RepID=A0AAN7RS88_MYCAM|nr:hypothetical protein QYF61_008578 [Mycteria americana]
MHPKVLKEMANVLKEMKEMAKVLSNEGDGQSAEGDGQWQGCCISPLKGYVNGRGLQSPEKDKCTSHLQERQEGGSRELQAEGLQAVAVGYLWEVLNLFTKNLGGGLLTLFPCSSVRSLPQETVLHKLLQRSQVLPENLLQRGLLSPQGHRSCKEPAPVQGPTGSQPPLGIHLLWHGVLHGLQVDICSTMDLHGLQRDSLSHHGLHHGLQGNLCSGAWSTSSPSFFTGLVFTSKTGLQKSKNLDTSGKFWSKEDLLLVAEDQTGEYLSKLNLHNSIGPNGMHPQALRDLADDWRKAKVTPIFKKGKKEDPGNYRPVSLTSIPGQVMEYLISETISRHMKDKKVIESSKHGFKKGSQA